MDTVRGAWCLTSTDVGWYSDTRSSESQLEIVSGADARGRVSESEAKSEESEESEQGECFGAEDEGCPYLFAMRKGTSWLFRESSGNGILGLGLWFVELDASVLDSAKR